MSFPLWGYATGAILPSLWSLSSAELSAGGKKWLTPDGTIQRTSFGDSIELVASFGSGDFRHGDTNLRKESILVLRRDGGKSQIYVPR